METFSLYRLAHWGQSLADERRRPRPVSFWYAYFRCLFLALAMLALVLRLILGLLLRLLVLLIKVRHGDRLGHDIDVPGRGIDHVRGGGTEQLLVLLPGGAVVVHGFRVPLLMMAIISWPVMVSFFSRYAAILSSSSRFSSRSFLAS